MIDPNEEMTWNKFMPDDVANDIYDPEEEDEEPTSEDTGPFGKPKSWFPNLNLNPRKKNNE